VKSVGRMAATPAHVGSSGVCSSSTMMVMMMARTPSLKASSRFLFTRTFCPHTHAAAASCHFRKPAARNSGRASAFAATSEDALQQKCGASDNGVHVFVLSDLALARSTPASRERALPLQVTNSIHASQGKPSQEEAGAA